MRTPERGRQSGASPHAEGGATLVPGQRLGVYEILAPLGAGGMGEVFRARDIRLGREVAVKVLPRSYSGDQDRQARFEREARALASLNHPHIATIYEVEESDGIRALILELVPGDTLAERIAQAGRTRAAQTTGSSGLSIEATLRIARQIVDALDAAHERGIIHRDLKPANIKVTSDDVVKVLDFGLAKLVESGQVGVDDPAGPSDAVTATGVGTQAGLIVGTAAYMSPEQARGQMVDKRADIWAFGCVLMEMLTGRAPFARATATDTLAAVIEREPDWSGLPASTPAGLRRLLRQCLQKDPRLRLRDIGDARLELDGADEDAGSVTTAAPSSSPGPLVLALAGATLAAVAVLVTLAVERRRASPDVGSQPTPAQMTLATADDGVTAEPALSNDGSLLAYASDRAGHGNLDIWVQQTAGSTPLQLTRDLLDEHEPDFSPDGSRVAYRLERGAGALYTIPAFGGQEPRLLVEGGRRPRFSPDGQSVAYWTGSGIGFAAEPGSYRTFVIPSGGGSVQEVKGFTGARFPAWAPDGRSLLLLGSRATRPTPDTYDWWLVPLDGGEAIRLGADTALKAAGVPFARGDIGPGEWRNGRVLFAADGYVWSVQLTGRDAALASPSRLTFGTNQDAAPRSSASGTIAFASISSRNSIWALPIDGAKAVVRGEPRRMSAGVGIDSRPSPGRDGQVFVYRVFQPRPSLLLRNLAKGTVTDLGVAGSGFGPALSPDGTLIAYEDGDGMNVISSEGGSPRALCKPCRIGAWFSDSRSIAVVKEENSAGRLAIAGVDGTLRDVIVSTGQPVNRPFPTADGRLIAFRRSTQTTDEVLVAPIRPDGPSSPETWRTLVAPEADARPSGWSPDGGVLYFLSARDGARCLYAQRVDRTTGAPLDAPVALRHFHGGRRVLDAGANTLSTGPGTAIAGGFFWYDLTELSSNIWTIR